MSLPDDVLELLWLYHEWQLERGETVEHPIPRPRGVIDGLPGPQPLPPPQPQVLEYLVKTLSENIARQDEIDAEKAERMREVELEMQRRHEEWEARKEATQVSPVYIPASLDPVEEAGKLAKWQKLRCELGMTEREDMKWLEDVIDDQVLDEKAIRWVWKKSPHLRRRGRHETT